MIHLKKLLLVILTVLISPSLVCSQESETVVLEEVVVTAQSETFATNETDESMVLQQSDITSVHAVIDNLPGVLVNEGNVYGSDDWSTSISIRGFQNSLDLQEI